MSCSRKECWRRGKESSEMEKSFGRDGQALRGIEVVRENLHNHKFADNFLEEKSFQTLHESLCFFPTHCIYYSAG